MKLGILLLAALPAVLCAPADLSFIDCFDTNGNATQKFTVSTVYAQVLHNDEFSSYLDLVVIADSPQDIIGRANSSLNLATLFTSTSILTLSAWSNSSYLCEQLRPTDDRLSASDTDDDSFCPIAAGPFALSAQIPWGSNRALTTLTTRLRAVDTYSNELLCLDLETTPLDPHDDAPYGMADIIFWGTVSLAIAYWLVVGVARIVSAWNRGISRPGKGLWERVQSAGFILASATSGERFASSPALLRFCTPSMRDVIFHTQWCSALAMIAVQWPPFIYPLLTQTAWATLSYNISLTAGSENHHWNPLYAPDFNPPSDFQTQLTDQSSSLYLDPSVQNTLFTLPANATSGMTSFAYSVGVRPEDLFAICIILFFGIVAAAVALSTVFWLIDRFVGFICMVGSSHEGPGMTHLGGTRSPAFGSKDMLDSTGVTGATAEEHKSLNGKESIPIIRTPSRFGLSGTTERGITSRKRWWRIRSSMSSFHGSVLQGNLVRILILFHLPVTIFSVYQMTLPKSRVSMSSIVLAGLSFAIISILIPALLVVRVRLTTTSKLYDETKTLLGLGPLYNHYRHGSQMFAGLFFATNVAFGVTIGAGQKSGTAQAIVILVVEVISALVTSIWLPWGIGASMGLISFLFCVARIVIAVLLLILTPAIDIGSGAGGWVAYGVLIILALVYLALTLMLVVKLVEALVRLFGFISFEHSKHVVDSGLFGACGLAGCCGSTRKRRKPRSATRKEAKGKDSVNSRYRNNQPGNRDSIASSFMGSLGSPTRPGTGKGSTHSGPPPSVLKPEHALRPYKEESDDENGYIMGAWQPFQTKTAQGYVPVESPATPKAPTSGFSRVGGGRSHIDSPYAIKAGSTQTFPSIAQHQSQHNDSVASLRRVDDDDEDTPSLSAINAVRHQQQPQRDDSLPPGAMPPFHIRTKSQTAIIEHACAVAGPSSFLPSGAAARPVKLDPTPPPSAYNTGGDEDAAEKKKPWYHLRRHRPHSSDGKPADEEAAILPPSEPAPTPGRSFVVVRKPQVSPARSQKLSTASAPGGPSRQSFPGSNNA